MNYQELAEEWKKYSIHPVVKKQDFYRMEVPIQEVKEKYELYPLLFDQENNSDDYPPLQKFIEILKDSSSVIMLYIVTEERPDKRISFEGAFSNNKKELLKLESTAFCNASERNFNKKPYSIWWD